MRFTDAERAMPTRRSMASTAGGLHRDRARRQDRGEGLGHREVGRARRRARPPPSGLGLVAVGGPGDRERAAQLIAGWPGAARDLCGRVSPRVSALILSKARLLIAHDSGPMHLAAAVGTPVAAIFSARAKPGIWFPRGAENRVFYEKLPCFDCGLESCTVERRRCITGIAVEPVLAACDAMLAGEKARAATVA
jgi:heptosyltransferase III